MDPEAKRKQMTLKYSDGKTVNAVLLARTETAMRVVIEGANDVDELSNIRGAWVSADCELVTVEFAWERIDRKPPVSEADCYCSHELAARLIHLLYTDSSEEAIETSIPVELRQMFGGYHLPV